MLPTYRPGDLLVGWRWFKPHIGQIVIAQTDRLLVKRITRIEPDGYWLEGDNKALSRDSRRFGSVGRSALVYTVLRRIARG